jgi:hypothetical protein
MKIRILAVAGLALLFGNPSFAQQAGRATALRMRVSRS